MLTRETLENGLIRTVSDTFFIKKVGTEELYSEAVDIPTAKYEYEEAEELLVKIINDDSFSDDNCLN